MKTLVEQTLNAILDNVFSREELRKFRVSETLPHSQYIVLSGPKQTVHAMFDLLNTQFANINPKFGEIVSENMLPESLMGLYTSGETPFGYIRGNGNALLVINTYALEDYRSAFQEMYTAARQETLIAIHNPQPNTLPRY